MKYPQSIRIPADSEMCLRCHSLVVSQLAGWHQCKGTNLDLRPANVTAAAWASSRADAEDAILLEMIRPPAPAPPPISDASWGYETREPVAPPLPRRTTPDYRAMAAAAVAVLLLIIMIVLAVGVAR